MGQLSVNGLLEEGFFYRRALRIAQDFPEIPFPNGWKANIRGVDLNLQFPAGWNMAKQIMETYKPQSAQEIQDVVKQIL